jgi:hypothetical protein
VGLSAPLAATTVDDYIGPGRTRLFDGTRSGPARSCDIFAAGLADANCPDSLAYRELLFLHALARTTILLGDPNDNVVPEGLLRWVEPFSAALATGVAANLPNLPPAWHKTHARQACCEYTARQIDDIVSELDSITDQPTPFVVILGPDETGLKSDLEIDYGDVLMFKSVLLACRTSLQEQTLYELMAANPGWLHDRHVLDRLDAWVASAPCLLGFDRSANDKRSWHAYWTDAMACYRDAVTHIAAENNPPGADPQQDELVYIDANTRAHIDRCTVAQTISGNTLATAQHPDTASGTKVYEVRDANSVRLGELVLVFDATDTSGHDGHLILDDGTSLEIDRFGVLDAGEIGISMFSSDQATQGWFQGAMAVDRSAITGAVVDFWGAETRVMVAITAQLTAEPALDPSDMNPFVGASLPATGLNAPLPLDELLARAGDEANWGM